MAYQTPAQNEFLNCFAEESLVWIGEAKTLACKGCQFGGEFNHTVCSEPMNSTTLEAIVPTLLAIVPRSQV